MSAGDERARDPRPTRSLRGIVKAGLKDGLGINNDSQGGQAVDHLTDAIDPAAPLLGEKRMQRRRIEIDEIAEDMNVGLVADGGDLDAGDEFDVRGSTRLCIVVISKRSLTNEIVLVSWHHGNL